MKNKKMDILMMNDDEECLNLLLYDADYPDYFVNKTHTNCSIEEIFHMHKGHNRLLLRICLKMDVHTYIPLTFVCDTGACTSIYLCKKAQHIFKSRILVDDLDNKYIQLSDGKKLAIDDTHENVNILGLKALSYFELFLKKDYTFGFDNLPEYF